MVYDNEKTYNSKLYASEWNTLVGDLMTNIEKDIFVPVAIRMVENAFVACIDDYIVVRSKICQQMYVVDGGSVFNVAAAPNCHGSWITMKQYGPYGTWEWIGKINETDAGEENPGGFEYNHGYGGEGLACYMHLSGSYETWTAANGTMGCSPDYEVTKLSNQDWTADTAFKIVRDSTHVYFYIDDELVSTHTSKVPTKAMGFFFEACSYMYAYGQTPPTKEARAFYKKNTFEQTT